MEPGTRFKDMSHPTFGSVVLEVNRAEGCLWVCTVIPEEAKRIGHLGFFDEYPWEFFYTSDFISRNLMR